MNGIATQRSAELGSRVNAAQQVMVVVQTDNVWGDANFKETQLRKMHVGQKVAIKVDSLAETFTGQVEYTPAATGDRNSLFPPENASAVTSLTVYRLGKEDLSSAIRARPELAKGLEVLAQRGIAALDKYAINHEEVQMAKPEALLMRLRNFLGSAMVQVN